MNTETVWEFKTANFRVTLDIAPEEMDPADSFDFGEGVEAVRNGDVEWFQATITVYGPNDEWLAWDSLGGCAYKSVREFYTSHRDPDPMNRNCSIMRAARGANTVVCRYFPDMVSGAIAAARANFKAAQLRACSVRLRA